MNTLLEFLRDPIWQFAGALIAILALGLSFFTYFAQRKFSEVAIGALIDTSLTSISKEIDKDIQIIFNGNHVFGVRSTLFGIKNCGTTAILESDFQDSIRLKSTTDVKVLSAKAFSVHPNNLRSRISATDSEVTIAPMLLNPESHLVIQILYSGEKANFKPDVQIANITEPKLLQQPSPEKKYELSTSILRTIIALAISFLLFYIAKLWLNYSLNSASTDATNTLNTIKTLTIFAAIGGSGGTLILAIKLLYFRLNTRRTITLRD
jgi:hypothetical protein